MEAFAVMAELTGNTDDAANYSAIAHDYVVQRQTKLIVTDAPAHVMFRREDPDPW